MKKTYISPTVEKIAFRYRDQVVAASGASAENGVIEETLTSQLTGGFFCSDRADRLMEGAIDLQVCDWGALWG